MHYLKFTIIIITLLAYHRISAQDLSSEKDSTLNKMQVYMNLQEEANSYEHLASLELNKVSIYKDFARTFLDSIQILALKAEVDKSHSQLYINQINYYYDAANKLLAKSDSLINIANAYKDSANIKNKAAKAYYLLLADQYEPVTIKQDTVNINSNKKDLQLTPIQLSDIDSSITYTVQVGCGNLNMEYFNKISDIKIIIKKDGLKRYVTGNFKSKKDALEYRKKIIELGYKDAFIQTIE
ncbi:MAG TPA: hypothetical protein PKY41_13290 [Bacteroidales bacterium]|nr:hypothetical protein [Bacteroidales bacterium]